MNRSIWFWVLRRSSKFCFCEL